MEWLQKWLELPFYESGQSCRRHNHYNIIYCSTCMERPVCEICWRKKCLSKLHQGNNHRILRVVRASNRPAIKIAEAVKLVDASGIQVYRINGNSIFHLHPSVGSDAAAAIDEPCCVTCLRTLKKPGYDYCSIACKFEKEGRNMEIKLESGSSSPSSDIDFEKGENFQASAASTSTHEIEHPNPKRSTLKLKIKMAKNPMNGSDQCSGFVSLRKRSRKGIPRRAPLQ